MTDEAEEKAILLKRRLKEIAALLIIVPAFLYVGSTVGWRTTLMVLVSLGFWALTARRKAAERPKFPRAPLDFSEK